MSRQRFVLLLIAALVAISAALLLATQRNSSHETQGVALFPALAGNLNAVTALAIGKGGAMPATTLEKSATGWGVMERGGYPADIARLRKLLTALGEAKIVEEKTADPARYELIGVEDPSRPGATGSQITVVMPGGKQSVIVGKSVGEGSFVRRAGEQRSYSVEPGIPVESEPHFWIDSRLLDVPVTKIQGVQYKPAGSPAYAIHRSAADSLFSLEGVPAGRKALDANALAPAPTSLTGLTAEDVSSLDGIDFAQPFVTIVTLADGEIITLTGVVAGTKHWVQVGSSKDAALTTRTQGRAFEVPSYRYDAIFKPLEQMLVAKAAPVPKAAPATKTAPVPKSPDAAAGACCRLVLSGTTTGFGRRFAALIYDVFLLAALLIIFTFAALVFTGGHAIMRDTAGDWYYLYRSGEIGVVAAYYILNWVRSGQTLGMRAWRLRVVSAAGKPLRIHSAILRCICGFFAWAPAALGVLWLYVDPERLALHDRLSDTRVVRLTRS